jgi:hypothetical protein
MYHYVAAQSSFMTVWVSDTHAHVQNLVSEMANVLEVYTTEDQRSVVRILWAKVLMQSIFIKKCFLYTVGSVYWVE